jgi:hypothetical protein
MSSSHGFPAVCTSLLDFVPVTVTLSSSHGLVRKLSFVALVGKHKAE